MYDTFLSLLSESAALYSIISLYRTGFVEKSMARGVKKLQRRASW